MIRSLRRRFIFGAMLALTILLIVLTGGITLSGYLRMESAADSMLDSMLTDEMPQPPARMPQPVFGYRLREQFPSGGHYDLLVDADGNITDFRSGNTEDEASISLLVSGILASGDAKGKTESFKFRIQPQSDGSSRILLLDLSVQIRMLLDTLRTSCLAGLLCLGGMLLILLPLSATLVRSYAAHIEKQKRFITDAGHEIKTPAAIIMANIDAMEMIQGENKWSRNIRSQTTRLNGLIQQLLFMARIDERSIAFPLEPVDVAALLRDETECHTELLAKKSIGLSIRTDECRPIRANADTLRQLISILLDNAAQYTDEGGRINVLLEKRTRTLRLTVSNTVTELPDCPPDALFERFFRADKARTQSSGGCGIGLSAAQSITELHRGQLRASYPDERTVCFTLDLPR